MTTDPDALTEAERVQIAQAGDHHPEQCDCSPYAVDGGYPDHDICDGLADTFAAVNQILAARTAALRADIARDIKAVFADPDRLRPLARDAETATDLATDAEWCAQIALGGTDD